VGALKGVAVVAAVNDIKAGDVLLFNGSSFISKAIRFFDGAPVNHAALALDGGQLGEAAGSGLRFASVAGAVHHNNFTVIRALPAPTEVAPVVKRGQSYVQDGAKYAYQQIAFLAILGLTRQVPLPPIGRRMMRAVLDKAAAALNALLEGDRQLMICSEYVYRCYDEAHDGALPNPYALNVLPGAFAAGEPSLVDWALALDDDRLPAPEVIPTFETPPDLATVDTEAEAELGPLIGAYLAEVESGAPALTFGDAEPDDALLQSMVNFGAAIEPVAPASGGDVEPAPVTFGLPDPRQALERVRTIAADPNFVTPGDLLRTASLGDRFRLERG
jgi:hypothetical protein